MEEELQRLTVEALVKSWGSPLVPRIKFEEFSGGLFTAKTMANYDSLNKGPTRLKGTKRAFYLTTDAAVWLVAYQRSRLAQERRHKNIEVTT